jgi:hypothetical protein
MDAIETYGIILHPTVVETSPALPFFPIISICARVCEKSEARSLYGLSDISNSSDILEIPMVKYRVFINKELCIDCGSQTGSAPMMQRSSNASLGKSIGCIFFIIKVGRIKR